MISDKNKAIIYIILCAFFTAGGQIGWKLGVKTVDFSDWITLFNWPFFFGFVSYGLGLLLMLQAFKRGDLSLLYPLVATSYIWVSLASPYFFPTDSMNWLKWLGIALILVSVWLLGKNTKKKEMMVEVHG